MKIQIFSDGGARGNPGPAGIGVVIKIDNQDNRENRGIKREEKISKYIGTATNNQAEYRAVIEALNWIKENQGDIHHPENLEIECFLDSKLVVEQLNQNYKLKNEGLKPLFWQIRDLVVKLGGKVSFQYIPREQNQEADRLVNQALDNRDNRED